MKNLLKNILILSVFTVVIGCETFEPIDENRLDYEFVSSVPEFAEGILLNGYTGLVNQYSFSEAATDDAVNNQQTNGYKRIALGELTAQFNPAARWNNYERVFWMNQFLEIVNAEEIVWSVDTEVNKLFNDRMKGEALALRALHHFYVLQAHAGKNASDELLGIPYFTEFIKPDGNFNVPRLSFTASVEAIMKDFDDALVLLPTDYTNNEGAIDAKYNGIDIDNYKRVNGAQYNLRISGRIVKALKARLALFAASPSFLNDNNFYTLAAENAADIINSIGGVAGLDSNGLEFYLSDSNIKSSESLWRGSEGNPNTTYEERMFPPSVNGSGEINPTQNLVDAFPMIDGTPIAEASSYDSQNPFANRDPRLEKYIIVNGSSFAGGTINTGFGGGIDRLDSISRFSTTTGYYLKKLLRPDARINSDGTTSGKIHANVYFRYTELFLILAEAANEIGGPDFQVQGISAKDVISAIRVRAGITQPDNYLASITDKDDMRKLIRNERRIELSFEGHRFWDLRRWGVSLNETAVGSYFDGTSYSQLPVETRNFQPFATYMPIPNAETIKFPELEQNNGW
ncbi:RagB/SusD family nutrient uptake outer membrane protein [uncultured Polaribacter sp.]|uniref:RagB/SusD family nutrient uptake outer membrane protein n=1 Tax=uncultured Polaribacter sp. TaxID=174711 RepID=UPI0026220FBA|nr:RagB/SusD family nutrient uptake outer membrane protein [uncultured Polaribacter sp.]